MVRQKQVCIVGAGVSGLAAAKAFSARGHHVTIVERSGDLGGVWEPARSYPDVQTQSPKELYRYTDKAMPESYPEWPKGPQVYAYLAEYARDHGLDRLIRFNTAVLQMNRHPDSRPGWRIWHSSQYNDPTIAKGRKVVVLGGSKSATDIAVNAVNSGASAVTLVYREPVWRIPYFIGGLINFKRILYIRAQEEMFKGWGIGALSRLKHAVAKPLVWANWRGLESLLKAQFKLKKCDMVPRGRIEDGVNCSVPIATPGFFPMVADGRIKAIRGSFDRYDGGTIVMTGGERVPAELAVLAIGYKLGVPFLPQAFRDRLVDPDGQYRLYRLIANPDLPDMGFVGFNSSFCTVLCADMAANWLVRYADGQLAHQPSPAEMRDNIDMMLQFKRVERPAAGVYGGLCVAPYHFKHFDELLADIGATKRRRGALTEKFTPPDADAYAQFLASAPDYAAMA